MKYFNLSTIILVLLLASCTQTQKLSHKPNSVELTEVFNLINEARANPRTCGNKSFPAVPKLKYNNLLAKAAQNHSIDMNNTATLTHLSPAGSLHYNTGTSAIQRIQQGGYQPTIIRENIAHGQKTAVEVVNKWLASPSHCSTIMNSNVSETGLGHSGDYWTQDFGQSQ